MKLELKDIKGGCLEQDYVFTLVDFPELQELAAEGAVVFHEPIKFHLRFQKSGLIVEVDGSLAATLTLSCGRCLGQYEQEISETFALTFTPDAKEHDAEEEIELEADELGLILYRDEVLELTDPLQEQLLMAIPISPLCRQECQGLCSECGVNLNVASCSCEKKIFNNKFSALAGMRLKD